MKHYGLWITLLRVLLTVPKTPNEFRVSVRALSHESVETDQEIHLFGCLRAIRWYLHEVRHLMWAEFDVFVFILRRALALQGLLRLSDVLLAIIFILLVVIARGLVIVRNVRFSLPFVRRWLDRSQRQALFGHPAGRECRVDFWLPWVWLSFISRQPVIVFEQVLVFDLESKRLEHTPASRSFVLTKCFPSNTSESLVSQLSTENSEEGAGDEHSEILLVAFFRRPRGLPISFGARCGHSISCDSRSGKSMASLANIMRVLGCDATNPLSVSSNLMRIWLSSMCSSRFRVDRYRQ